MVIHEQPNEPVDVCLSVDVEFSPNSAFARPWRPILDQDWIYGVSNGASQGLGFLLECLERYGLKGTFFTETFNTHALGDRPMAAVVEDILRYGHDVQLHLHPVWRRFIDPRWREEPKRPPIGSDSFAGRDPRELVALLAEGVEILERLSGVRPIAFRCGNLDAVRGLYPGLREVGLTLASNVGVALKRPSDPKLRVFSGTHRIDGVTEVPVTTYRVPHLGQRLLLLTISGSSFLEIRTVLENAARHGTGPIVLLLHAHDLRMSIPGLPTDPPRYRRDSLRQRRLEKVCQYLSARPDRYRVTTFKESAAKWAAASQDPEVATNTLVEGSLAGVAMRAVENRLLAPYL
jgi:peptidoglycan/xylan/chitin deacetylase (PgdA/CDA1 family)